MVSSTSSRNLRRLLLRTLSSPCDQNQGPPLGPDVLPEPLTEKGQRHQWRFSIRYVGDDVKDWILPHPSLPFDLTRESVIHTASVIKCSAIYTEVQIPKITGHTEKY